MRIVSSKTEISITIFCLISLDLLISVSQRCFYRFANFYQLLDVENDSLFQYHISHVNKPIIIAVVVMLLFIAVILHHVNVMYTYLEL
jgi:hypothetical protein